MKKIIRVIINLEGIIAWAPIGAAIAVVVFVLVKTFNYQIKAAFIEGCLSTTGPYYAECLSNYIDYMRNK